MVWGEQARLWQSINDPECTVETFSRCDCSSKKASEFLNTFGFLVVRDFLPKSLNSSLHSEYDHLWSDGWQKVTPTIHQGFNRADCELNLVEPALSVLREFAQTLRKTLVTKLGEDPTIEELAVLVSFPGAAEQPFHPDSEPDPNAATLITAFIPLVDLSLSMGPLEIVPGSKGKEAIPDDMPSIVLDVKAGTAIVMDSTTWHRGRDNVSQVARPVLYFSMLGTGTPPTGPTWTMGSGQGSSAFQSVETGPK